MPSFQCPPQRELRDELAANLTIFLIVIDLARNAEARDSPVLSELTCLIAAMHAQLAAIDPGLVTKTWDFVSSLRELHRVRDGRHDSLAGYLQSRGESLASLLAPTNLRAALDGALSCDSLGALSSFDLQ